jgi:hypothetical protein
MTDVRIISPDDWARLNECESNHLKIIVDKRGYVFPFGEHKLVEVTIRVGEDGPDVISSTSPEARKILELEAEIKRLRARHAEVVKWLQDGADLFSGKYDLFKRALKEKEEEEND